MTDAQAPGAASPPAPAPPPPAPPKRAYVRAVGPRLRRLLAVVFALTALLTVDSVYLATITCAEWLTGAVYQGFLYQYAFLGHLGLGLALALTVIPFGLLHLRNTRHRRNRRAVRAGHALFIAILLLLGTGFLLMRLEGIIEVRSPGVRATAYWLHVALPLVTGWLYWLHRLAGPRIRWRRGALWGGVALGLAGVLLALHTQDPRRWNEVGPASGARYFEPSLARTATGGFIPAQSLMRDRYCEQCHEDAHAGWKHSMHRFSSFNNPPYLFSVRETRRVALARDGDVQAARFCAGCHDPVPFFSGAFDDPQFDDERDPTAHAGITCTVCHAITHVNSPRGNADYTIEEPLHYPFAFAESPALQWLSRQLVRAKPSFHKKTFLKPLHQTAEFCGACHKVHLPEALNRYKFLRGQNHYDTFLQSGVSGHGVTSFYYPKKAETDCNRCHMPLEPSEDFGARVRDAGDDSAGAGAGEATIHGHQFPSANTAIPHLLGFPPEVNEAHRRFLEGSLRVDVFGLKAEGRIDGALTAPLRPEAPRLRPGSRYLAEVVVRTLTLGHPFTQGTADSNQVWLDVTLRDGDQVIGRSGALDAAGVVDPWSHFVNAYVLDREGRRIDRRNAQDIFVALYNHQIPPGAADAVHFAFTVPEGSRGPLALEVALRYRKFDTTYMRYVYGEGYRNDLPIVTIATDRVPLGVEGGPAPGEAEVPAIAPWQRWNDYGIGLLRKRGRGELRQAEAAFAEVERLARPDGPLDLARVYLREGRLEEAAAALDRAAASSPPAAPWSVAWFAARVNKERGELDAALEGLHALVDTRWQEARDRGFDFARDTRLQNELGQTLFERAKLERGAARQPERARLLGEARRSFERSLAIDPENVSAHHNLALVLLALDEPEAAARHRDLHGRYKPDDNARDRAIARHRGQNPAADHAAADVVIYDLQRPGAPGLHPRDLEAPR